MPASRITGSARDPSAVTGRAQGLETHAPEPSLVVDWDGTVTVRDVGELVMLEFGDRDVFEQVEAELGNSLNHNELIALEFGTVRASLTDVVDFVLREARIRPGFHELAKTQSPLVVSGTFHELIEPVLAREGLDLDLRANRLDPRTDGWRVVFRTTKDCGECGEPCKRAELPAGEVVYVGDGYYDRCAALAANRVFARDGLARYLDRRGVPYEPFVDFHDVAAALAD
jgi:2-hydroxy-3-keto-5-methylthiopentenyl-1-phosphate phosphatase